MIGRQIKVLNTDDEPWEDEWEEEPTIQGIGFCEPLYDYIGDGKMGITERDIKKQLKDVLHSKDKCKIEVYFKGMPLIGFHNAVIVINPIQKYGFNARAGIEDAIVYIYTQDGDSFGYNTEKNDYYIVIKAKESEDKTWETLKTLGKKH